MVSWTVTVSRMTMVFVTKGGSGRVSKTGTLVGSVCRDAINRVSTILHACTLGDGLQRQRGKIRLMTQIVDAMVHGDARQPMVEIEDGSRNGEIFHCLQENILRQVLRHREIVHVAVTQAHNPAKIALVLHLQKFHLVHLISITYSLSIIHHSLLTAHYYIMTRKSEKVTMVSAKIHFFALGSKQNNLRHTCQQQTLTTANSRQPTKRKKIVSSRLEKPNL